MEQSCVVLAANRGYALTSSRTSLIQHFLRAGWRVVLATAEDEESRSLCGDGVHLEPVTFSRRGFAPRVDLASYRRLHSIYQRWRPTLVQHFHAKPVILGSLAARRALGDSVRVSNVITGLGHAFIKGGMSAFLAGQGYRSALPRADLTIFQNRDDMALFLKRGWLTEASARLIASSGVDLERFAVAERNGPCSRTPIVLMLGRLLKQKGIQEFIEVARCVRGLWPDVRFLLAGEEDLVHPDAVTADWVRAQGEVEYLGRVSDVTSLLKEADLLLFPSYREGTPRVVLEAAATGLPTVGFDVPGVREAVKNGETGYLVRHKDVEQLTERVVALLENDELRLRMGNAARRMVEKDFDIRTIEKQYLDVYRELSLEV